MISLFITSFLNQLVGTSPLLDRALILSQAPEYNGILLVALVFVLWTRHQDRAVRVRLCVDMLAATAAGVLSRFLQLVLRFNVRPIYVTGLHLRYPGGILP